MTPNIITSPQNPKVKRLVALQQKSAERRKSGTFVVEGQRELMHCIVAGMKVLSVFFCPQLMSDDNNAGSEKVSLDTIAQLETSGTIAFEITPEVYEKVAYRSGTEGVIAEIEMPESGLETLRLGEAPLIVVLESVEKPGNLGAVLRSADAAGVDAVIVCDPRSDLFNPNVIRSSIGAIFSVQCVACTTEQCVEFLKGHGIQILTAQLQDSSLYYDTDMRRPTAIVMGTESTGLTPVWRDAADAHIRIPMLGRLDSLNVSVSAAILMFEAIRQRQLTQ